MGNGGRQCTDAGTLMAASSLNFAPTAFHMNYHDPLSYLMPPSNNDTSKILFKNKNEKMKMCVGVCRDKKVLKYFLFFISIRYIRVKL